MISCRLLDLEHLDYERALDLMRGLVEVKVRTTEPDVLMLLEHEPVLTMGRRSAEGDVLVSRERLEHLGVRLYRIERGGLVTYHGPGQLVVYPIFQLRSLKVGLVDFVRRLEQIIMATLAGFGLKSQIRPGHPGVFMDQEKIASIGMAVRHGITFHGLALNYAPDLSHFDLINPCGLTDTRMTSMQKRLGRPVDARRLRRIMAGHFARTFGLEMTPWTLKEAEKTVESNVSVHAKAAVA